MRTFAILAAFVVLALSASWASADVVTLSPDQDVYTSSLNNTTNYGGSADLYIGKGTYWDLGFWRGYLEFDLSAIQGTINSASLKLYQYDTGPAAGGLPCDLHRVTASWSENTITWSTQPPHNSTIINSQNVGDSFYTGWITWNVTSLVRDWVEYAVANDGLAIKHYYESTAGASRYGIFRAQESSAADQRPALVIDYEPFSPVETASWGSIKALYR